LDEVPGVDPDFQLVGTGNLDEELSRMPLGFCDVDGRGAGVLEGFGEGFGQTVPGIRDRQADDGPRRGR